MRKPTSTILAALFVSMGLILFPSCSGGNRPGEARFTENSENIRTYPFGDPDPVPILARSSMWGRGERLYPYFFFDGFSSTGIDRDWTVVRLRNKHIEVSILPQAGGKVWGASETATGREFIYWNHVLKFRQIALRGPWTSGGIEFNFGIVGHSPTTATPVDYLTRKNPDGSVSCFVGTMDLPSRTRWCVEIRLPKDAALFETNATWINPTPYGQSYYAWSCAAVRTAEDLEYIFPGLWYIGHDYSVPLRPWPVDLSGRDLSLYRNNATPGSKSYFTVGEFEDFYGGWYEKSDTGFGHWARYDDMPGRKIWIWDQSRSGEIWVDLLTDSDGQYTEPQAGRLLNQSDHANFPPGTTDKWQELWFPYRGIGPMVKASPEAVLSVRETEGVVSLGLFPLKSIDDDIVVVSGGREVFRERLKLRPEEDWKELIPDLGVSDEFIVLVGDKLRYESSPAADDIGRPFEFRSFTGITAEGLFLQGRTFEKERRYAEALDKYLACIEKEPLHVRSLCRTAELLTRRGEPRKALDFAGRALRLSMYDPEANYIYGLAARREGRLRDAKETLGWASRSPEYRAPARLQLVEIGIVEGDFAKAVEEASKLTASDALNVSGLEILAVAERLAGMKKAAGQTLDRLLDMDPLNHFARFEKYLLSGDEEDLIRFNSLIRHELPHETYLEISALYRRLGLLDDAVAVLRQSPEQAEVLYWLSYLLQETGSPEGENLLNRASNASPALVFPFREESIPVFQKALAARPSDWKPKYYLGLVYWGKGRLEEARDLFAMCEGSDFGPFFMTRGSLFEPVDPAYALIDYRKAVEIDGMDWRARHNLTGFFLRHARNREALTVARTAEEDFPGETLLRIDLVRALLAEREFAEAAGILDEINSLPYEGASDIHRLYLEIHVALGLEAVGKRKWSAAIDELEKSKLYPENLGTGKPFEPDFRLQDYLIALCYDRLGRKDAAEETRQGIYDYTIRHQGENTTHGYFGGLILQRFGKREDRLTARELLGKSRPPAEVLTAIRLLEGR